MTIKTLLNNDSPETVETPCLVIGVSDGGSLSASARQIDDASDGAISRLLASRDIDPGQGKSTLVHGLEGVAAERVMVVGFGKSEKLDSARFDGACLAAGKSLRDNPVTECHICLHDVEADDRPLSWRLRQAALGILRGNYRYTATKAAKKDDPKPLKAASFQGEPVLQDALDQSFAIAAGFNKARQLGDLPANICNPAYLAQEAATIAEAYESVELEILEEESLADLGMDALLGVARGSANRPRLIVLKYRGAEESDRPYVFVGKGITFDSGGLSLKSPRNMEQMKYDMCGAAGVMGALIACAQLGLPLNLIAVVPAVENMPDADAYRPGDVLTSMSGKTVEVLNTDAEGRLILCDALTWSQKFEPRTIIDVATLTGAVVVALGDHTTGLMSNDDQLAEELLSAGTDISDRAWRLPIWDVYQSQLDSAFADMKNVGGSSAGAITAGCFLSRFAEDQRWAHLDVAGTAFPWDGKDGASGRPVGLLTQYLIDESARN
jgi:leucyl aminopeptidase